MFTLVPFLEWKNIQNSWIFAKWKIWFLLLPIHSFTLGFCKLFLGCLGSGMLGRLPCRVHLKLTVTLGLPRDHFTLLVQNYRGCTNLLSIIITQQMQKNSVTWNTLYCSLALFISHVFPVFSYFWGKMRTLQELVFFTGKVVTHLWLCIGDLQEEQIAQRTPVCVFQGNKCINICTASVRDRASYCLVVNRK